MWTEGLNVSLVRCCPPVWTQLELLAQVAQPPPATRVPSSGLGAPALLAQQDSQAQRLVRIPPNPSWYALPSSLAAAPMLMRGLGLAGGGGGERGWRKAQGGAVAGATCVAFPLGPQEGAAVESQVRPGGLRAQGAWAQGLAAAA